MYGENHGFAAKIVILLNQVTTFILKTTNLYLVLFIYGGVYA